jgi:hypothetical protein
VETENPIDSVGSFEFGLGPLDVFEKIGGDEFVEAVDPECPRASYSNHMES